MVKKEKTKKKDKDQKLEGGLSTDNGNEKALVSAREKLASRKRISIASLRQELAAERKDDGRIDAIRLSYQIKETSDTAYEWISNVACPFIRQLDKEVRSIGKEVLEDVCEDGEQKKKQRREDYETTIDFLLAYSTEQDEAVREELKRIPGRKDFFNALFHRVNYSAKLAMLVYDLRNAEDEEHLETLIREATDGISKDAKKVFLARDSKKLSLNVSATKASVRIFGQSFDFVTDCFGHYHEFAQEKLPEAINICKKELAKIQEAETEKLEEDLSGEDESQVSPEELLFDDSDDVNEKTAYFPWKYQQYKQGLKLQRSGDRLYILGAVGRKPSEDLEAMRDRFEKPYVSLWDILDSDGKHLCLGKMTGVGPKYEFGNYFPMKYWVRRAAGTCIPHRLLPNDDTASVNIPTSNIIRKRIVKVQCELLTDQEFLYYCGLGEYELIYEPGFRYRPENEENVQDQSFEITTRAVALLERKEVSGKDKIELKSASTDELVKLFQAGGAIVGHDFFEGEKGSSLPKPIMLGIRQAFGRLKRSEEKKNC